MTVINSVEHLRQMSDPIKATTETKIHMAKMTYQEWKTLIEGPALSRNLTIMGIKDTSTVTARLMQTLVEQQSLFTMTAR